jgi:DNA repair protein RadC
MRDLPIEVRPREKLLALGPAALSDTELLALLLRTGTPGRHVLHMASELLAQFGGISGLLQTQAKDLQRFKGLGGTAKRAELLAVLELSRRALAEQLRQRPVLDSPERVKHLLAHSKPPIASRIHIIRSECGNVLGCLDQSSSRKVIE